MKWETLKFNYDRGVKFIVDEMDNEETGITQTWLYMRGSKELEAGSRNAYTSEKILFTYEALRDDMAQAVDRLEAEGAMVVNTPTKVYQPQTEKLDFNEPYISKRDEDKIDFSQNDKKAQIVAEVLPAEKRKACFDEVSLGLTVEQAQKEAERCLECGCREYFKCKLLNVAQRYEIHPERFAGEMPQKYTKDSNSFIERNTAKCILCGLCVRSCREVEQLSVLGLLGRGFKTSVAPAFALPLDQTKCTNCGLCVSLCPTGALTEKSNLKKQVPLAEKYSLETLEIDGKKCDYLVSRYDGKILRAVPHNENARKCALEREDVISKLS